MEDLQFDYVRVSEEFEVLDLSPDLAHHVQTPDLLSVQDLHRHLVLRQLMLANCEGRDKIEKEKSSREKGIHILGPGMQSKQQEQPELHLSSSL